MASEEKYPLATWQRTVTGELGEKITVVSYAPEADEANGAVTIDVEDHGEAANILLNTPAQRGEFARAYMEACLRADGEDGSVLPPGDGARTLLAALRANRAQAPVPEAPPTREAAARKAVSGA